MSPVMVILASPSRHARFKNVKLATHYTPEIYLTTRSSPKWQIPIFLFYPPIIPLWSDLLKKLLRSTFTKEKWAKRNAWPCFSLCFMNETTHYTLIIYHNNLRERYCNYCCHIHHYGDIALLEHVCSTASNITNSIRRYSVCGRLRIVW